MPRGRRLTLLSVAAALLCQWSAAAHDFERTQVVLAFASDGSYVLEVANDSAWLEHRLIPFDGSFLDRVVLFVDGREVRPGSLERVAAPPLTIYRMRGVMPRDARVLRWYYGLPIDPYPLTVRRADGRILAQEIAGDAWSQPIDLSGQFNTPFVSPRTMVAAIAALFLVPITIRLASKRASGKSGTTTVS